MRFRDVPIVLLIDFVRYLHFEEHDNLKNYYRIILCIFIVFLVSEVRMEQRNVIALIMSILRFRSICFLAASFGRINTLTPLIRATIERISSVQLNCGEVKAFSPTGVPRGFHSFGVQSS